MAEDQTKWGIRQISDDEDEQLWWSNEDGWVDPSNLTIFTNEERKTRLQPINSEWVKLAKFILRVEEPTWVRWTYEYFAPTEEAAHDMDHARRGDPVGDPEIRDRLDFFDDDESWSEAHG